MLVILARNITANLANTQSHGEMSSSESVQKLLGLTSFKAGRHPNISARNDLGSICDGSLSLTKVLKRTEHKSLDV